MADLISRLFFVCYVPIGSARLGVIVVCGLVWLSHQLQMSKSLQVTASVHQPCKLLDEK